MRTAGGTLLLLLLGLSGSAAQGTNCIDDPRGAVAATGNTCRAIVQLGCDVDFSEIWAAQASPPCDPGDATCVPGCTNVAARNYSPAATSDDGSCDPVMVSGVCPSSCASCGQVPATACTPDVAVQRINEVMRACCPGGHRRAQDAGCPYTDDNECDEGTYCPAGSDTHDCCLNGAPRASDPAGVHVDASSVCCGGSCSAPTCDLPEACPSERCAAAFITLMDDCQGWLAQQNWPAPQMAQFHRFKDRCQTLSDGEQANGVVSCTASCGGVATTGAESCVSDGWIWSNLPCAPHMQAQDRSGEINPDHDVRCHCHSLYSQDADYAYSGPQSAAECAHLLCHYSGSGTYLFDTCSWDGEVIATAQPARDQSMTTITSDPSLFCVSCAQTTAGGATDWEWNNLPCEPGMDYESSRYDMDPEGNERCQCHDSVTGQMAAFDGPASASQCGHLVCDPTFDYCAWDGHIVAEGTAGVGDSTTITSDPSGLCDAGPVRPTCSTHGNQWFWSGLPCEATFEHGERRWDDTPEGDERCTCHAPDNGTGQPAEYAYDGPQSPADCSHIICHKNNDNEGFLFTSCSWDGEIVVTAEPHDVEEYTEITSDPHNMCVTCTNNPHLDGTVWTNLPCEGSFEWTEREYSAEPADAMCHCHVWDWSADSNGDSSGNIGSIEERAELQQLQARMSDADGLYHGISYSGPQNLAQCGHLICHRGANPTYVFDVCMWGPISPLGLAGSYDFSQTVLAATGEHRTGDSMQTITSDPELLCLTADADEVTCRREHIASDGSGGGWIWNNLPCETGIDMENQHWDSTPEGTERCQCHRKNGNMPYFDGPTSAAQCAHLICHTGAPDAHSQRHYDWDSCSWDGVVVATAEEDPNHHFTRLTSDPATLCAGINPDPLGKCKGSWDRPDADGCVGIVQRGRACRGGDMPCDGLAHEGDSWTEGSDENGRYLQAHGTGNFLRYTHDFGTGDFTMTAQMKLFDLDGSAGTFMINDGHFGFEGACQCTFTEGGFFGGVLNTDLDSQCEDSDNSGGDLGAGCTDPEDHGFVEGQLMTFRVERRGNVFTFWASELLVHTYRTDVAVASIGWRPHRATFFVYDWQVIRHG